MINQFVGSARENMKKAAKKFGRNKPECDFGYKHYREILNSFKDLGYNFCFFSEKPNPEKRQVYLRHDIDLTLEKALSVARIENEEKVNATYFIRLSGPFYNIFDLKNSKIIDEIVDLGHKIGFHYEGNIYGSGKLFKKETEKEILKSFEIMRARFEVEKVISFHRPPQFVLNEELENFISTYGARFFGGIKYLSDSKGSWREGCVCQWLRPLSEKSFQLLTHPVWWGREEMNVNKHLKNCLKEKFKYLDESMGEDSKVYQNRIFN